MVITTCSQTPEAVLSNLLTGPLGLPADGRLVTSLAYRGYTSVFEVLAMRDTNIDNLFYVDADDKRMEPNNPHRNLL